MSDEKKNSSFDLSTARSQLSISNQIARQIWMIVWFFLFRPSPRNFKGWRRFLLRLFGAQLGRNVRVCASCRIWAPWNLSVGDNSTMGDFVDCYSVAQVTLGANSIISQYTYICAATHDYGDSSFPLVPKPIFVGDDVWVAAGAYLSPGIRVNDGAIVGAKACVYKDVSANTVVGGNPAKYIKDRFMGDHANH